MRKIEPIAASVPYMVVAGNHEIWFNFSAYKTRFAMPGAATWRNNMFYSFHAGSVHFSGVNTESPIDLAEIGPRQVEWIKADLNRNTAANAAAVEARQRAEGRVSGRAAANWTIVYTHRPFYCSNTRARPLWPTTCRLPTHVICFMGKCHVTGAFFRVAAMLIKCCCELLPLSISYIGSFKET